MKTISIENAKRLDELRVKRDSMMCYAGDDKPSISKNVLYYSNIIPAYTADELGGMLPQGITSIWRSSQRWNCSKCSENSNGVEVSPLHIEKAETMADAMAQMLIWLIENRHVNAEEL